MILQRLIVRLAIKFTLAFIFTLLCINCHAEIYSWTDEHGHKHFSNISPGKSKIEETMDESLATEPFDPSMNAVPEEEIQAEIEKRRAEDEERKKRLEQERLEDEKKRLEDERKAKQEGLEREIEALKRRRYYERRGSRRRIEHHELDEKENEERLQKEIEALRKRMHY